MKANLRASEEPRDLAFWMVRAMGISVWLTLLMLPFGVLVFIGPPVVALAQDVFGERLAGTIFSWVVALCTALVVGLIAVAASPLIFRSVDRKLAANDELHRQFIEALERHMVLHPNAHIEFVESVDPEEQVDEDNP